MTDIFFILGGIILLFLGGDGLVRGSVAIADKLGLSNLLISTIVIGFGTSAPELMVSLQAALEGFPTIALANVIGSNISNTLLVLGLGASMAIIHCQSVQIKHDALMVVAVSIGLTLLSFVGYIHRLTGIIMLAILIIYLSTNVWKEKMQIKEESLNLVALPIKKKIESKKYALLIAMLLAIISLLVLAIGAHLLVNGAVSLANRFGISEAVIGLTLVAVGTSLPEIVTVCIASWRKHADIVIGNILGSNLFNILSILGVTALIKPIPFTGQVATQDVWIMVATSVVLFFLISKRKKITRMAGILLLALYAGYLLWLFLF